MKYPSLLRFDEDNNENIIKSNLKQLYGVDGAPSDTQMRTILDSVAPKNLRSGFNVILSHLQRGKALERYQYLGKYYLISLDGTGEFSSSKISCNECCVKSTKKGEVYYHQLLGAVIVHPDESVVIPLTPEPITKQDGHTKNDCERNASKRLLTDLRREHPHLPVIIVEDGLASNGPHIELLKELDMRFILGAKPGDHKALFERLYQETTSEDGKLNEWEFIDKEGTIHRFYYINEVPLNDSYPNLLVNVLDYWEIKSGKVQHFTWVTDFNLSRNNVFSIMRGGRARWKVENETFNTLKNQGYNLEHNYGHGEKHLSTVLAFLMMLAFLIDQVQQLCCQYFKEARKARRTKISLWQKIRALFLSYYIDNWEVLYESIIYGHTGAILRIDSS
jgi:hypothetical protein